VTTFDPVGAFGFSTYLGGSDEDFLHALGVAPDGRVRVVSRTMSTDSPGDPAISPRVVLSELSADGADLRLTQSIETNTPGSGHGLAVGRDDTTYFAGAEGVFVDPNMIHRDVLVVALGCPADIDGDGDADSDDFFAYLDLFASGDDRADIDGDGDRDADDFFAYLDLFAVGCV